jgi:ATP-binding cassette subfamily F protein uup
MTLLDIESLAMAWPSKPLFKDLSFTVKNGERIGVLGINGSGKSTLLRIIAGLETADSGIIRRQRGLQTSCLWQRPDIGNVTVQDAVGHSWQADAALDRLGLSAITDRKVTTLSGGQAKRVALAITLLDNDAELLILDEPTNHLDIEGIDFLERKMLDFRGGIILVTHDRHLLDRVATRTVALSRDWTLIVEGGYQNYLHARAEREEILAKHESARLTLARQELVWLQRGAKARRRKPKARLTVAHRTLTRPEKNEDRENSLGLGEYKQSRLGRKVIELENVSGGHDDEVPLFTNVNISLEADARLGVVGPNGSGKSTFLDILAGKREPLDGEVDRGSTVKIGYFDQKGDSLDSELTVEEVIAGKGSRLDYRHIALLGKFWFEPATHRAKVGSLSGGEQRRLQLLALLAGEPNVLLLDEPTNDLDLDTLRALEDWLDNFKGALVVVTHDRVFLERTIDHAVAINGGGLRVLGAGEAVWENAVALKKVVDEKDRKTKRKTANRRSSSTLERLIAKIDKEIAELTVERKSIQTEMNKEKTDFSRLEESAKKYADVDEVLRAREEEWLLLSEELDS